MYKIPEALRREHNIGSLDERMVKEEGKQVCLELVMGSHP